MKQFQTNINGKDVVVDDNLKGFELHQKPSSNVAYFGIKEADNKLFMQFNNGTGFIYPEVPVKVLHEAVNAESIVKFFHASVKGKYEGEPANNYIALVPEDEEDDDTDFDEEAQNW